MDDTHDAARRSWVAGADGHAVFPLRNLPLGVFSPPGGGPRPGIAIGDAILDLPAAGLLPASATLNAFLAGGAPARTALRKQAHHLLSEGPARPELLHRAADCAMHLPCAVGDYTDFYAGIQHATNVGRLFGREQPLMPNYKHLPIGYHGRASTIAVSGTPVRRPHGQRKRATDALPSFGPSRNLDYELELGIWIGPGNALGEPIPIARAAEHIAGYCLLNDWSARDIQGWEYQPLGPFLGKSFMTTVSAWIITPEALAPYRVPAMPRGDDAPALLDYLSDAGDQAAGGLDVALTVHLDGQQLSRNTTADLYWTAAQMVAHHASNGCALRPGDLLGSGTISGAEPGSLLELSEGGRQPFTLPGGGTRRFLEDGDTVAFTGQFGGGGFGPCSGQVVA